MPTRSLPVEARWVDETVNLETSFVLTTITPADDRALFPAIAYLVRKCIHGDCATLHLQRPMGFQETGLGLLNVRGTIATIGDVGGILGIKEGVRYVVPCGMLSLIGCEVRRLTKKFWRSSTA